MGIRGLLVLVRWLGVLRAVVSGGGGRVAVPVGRSGVVDLERVVRLRQGLGGRVCVRVSVHVDRVA